MLKTGAWTHEEIEYLMLHYANSKTEDIAKELNCKESRVLHKANNLGLKKSKTFWRNVYYEKRVESSKKGQFKKGIIPHNKGVKMSEEVRQKCSRTWFKKGHDLNDKFPIGAIKLSGKTKKHRALFIKIGERRWKPYSRYVWEQHHGAIPHGHIIAFKDGNIENCNIENLMLMSWSENMNRNSFHRFTNELKSVIYLNKKIKKRIREITKNRNIKL